MSDIREPSEDAVKLAAKLLNEGQLVALPTETVYGLGVNARDGEAVARLYEAKGRPSFNPLIVHLPSLEAARKIAVFDAKAEMLAKAFWPGPLTLVLPLREDSGIHPLVTAGLDTIALRVPAHPLAEKVLTAASIPIAAPSANPSGRLSPTRAEHVAEGLGDKIALILDGGATDIGLESTIIKPGKPSLLLRPGGIARDRIEAVIGEALTMADGSAIIAPGMLKSHYAPGASLRLDAAIAEPDELLLGFGPDAPSGALNLSPTGDMREAAQNLFSYLRQLDAQKPSRIAVMPIPHEGLGEAINERLSRAAAPRD